MRAVTADRSRSERYITCGVWPGGSRSLGKASGPKTKINMVFEP